MTTNYIYLLQERESIRMKEPVYKVGRTEQSNHKRFGQYPKGSVLLFQVVCNNCKKLEADLLQKFKTTFKHRKDLGNEYFEGDHKVMIDLIYSSVKNEACLLETIEENINYTTTNDLDDDLENTEQHIKICKKVSEIFPDYKNDESFGGTKKYIKIVEGQDEPYVILYINEDLRNMIHGKIPYYDIAIPIYSLNCYVGDELLYFKSLLKKRILSLGKIYDINSDEFISSVNKSKLKIHVENYDETCIDNYNPLELKYWREIFEQDQTLDIDEKIRRLFNCNMIINDRYYATLMMKDYETYTKFNETGDFETFAIDIGFNTYKVIYMIKIKSKYYDKNFLRSYIPYAINWDKDGTYSFVNTFKKRIGLNDENTCYRSDYFFDDSCLPWDNMKYLVNISNKYKQFIDKNPLKKCINPNKYTDEIMSVYDH